jgi:carbonic anhydrase/acetyltransferase-like protein (isoleucine patch superfamily)
MILAFGGKQPQIDSTVFIAANAVVIGDVEIGSGTNIWFQSIIRDRKSVV